MTTKHEPQPGDGARFAALQNAKYARPGMTAVDNSSHHGVNPSKATEKMGDEGDRGGKGTDQALGQPGFGDMITRTPDGGQAGPAALFDGAKHSGGPWGRENGVTLFDGPDHTVAGEPSEKPVLFVNEAGRVYSEGSEKAVAFDIDDDDYDDQPPGGRNGRKPDPFALVSRAIRNAL
jgi:hypothetical protein